MSTRNDTEPEGRHDPAGHIRLQDTVSTVFARPGAMTVFLRYRMACPGCVMAPFMTLAEAAAAYRLDPDGLVADLNAAMLETEDRQADLSREPP